MSIDVLCDLIQTPKLDFVDFKVGDTITVKIIVKEIKRVRIQDFVGIVIAKRNRGIGSSFLVRRIFDNFSVEKKFMIYSPLIKEIIVNKRGDINKSKLYFLRNKYGKKAKIKEKI